MSLRDGPACRAVLRESRAGFYRERNAFLVFTDSVAMNSLSLVMFIQTPGWIPHRGFQSIWQSGFLVDHTIAATALLAIEAQPEFFGERPVNCSFVLAGEESAATSTISERVYQLKHAFDTLQAHYATVVDPGAPSWNVSRDIEAGRATPLYPRRGAGEATTPHAGAEYYVLQYGKNIVSLPGGIYRFCVEQGYEIFVPQVPVPRRPGEMTSPALAAFRSQDCSVMGLFALGVVSRIAEDAYGRPLPYDPAAIITTELSFAKHGLVPSNSLESLAYSGRGTWLSPVIDYRDYREILEVMGPPKTSMNGEYAVFRASVTALMWAGLSDEEINEALGQEQTRQAYKAASSFCTRAERHQVEHYGPRSAQLLLNEAAVLLPILARLLPDGDADEWYQRAVLAAQTVQSSLETEQRA